MKRWTPCRRAAFEQDARADHVGVNEILRRIDAAIDMRFGGEIDHGKKLVLDHELVHLVRIGDVGFEKFVAFAMFFDHTIEIGEVAGVGENVDVRHQGRLVMLQNVANKIAPDESAATGHENAHSAR